MISAEQLNEPSSVPSCIIQEQEKLGPPVEQFVKEAQERALVLPTGKSEDEPTLGSSPENMEAITRMADWGSRLAATPCPSTPDGRCYAEGALIHA